METHLKYWRLRRAMTIEELAKKTGMSTQTIVNIERHGNMPRPSTISRLAEALGITLEQLFEGAGGGNDTHVA